MLNALPSVTALGFTVSSWPKHTPDALGIMRAAVCHLTALDVSHCMIKAVGANLPTLVRLELEALWPAREPDLPVETWGALPADLLVDIFGRLPDASKRAGRLACRHWAAAIAGSVTKLRLSATDLNFSRRSISATFAHLVEVDLDPMFHENNIAAMRWRLQQLPAISSLHCKLSSLGSDNPEPLPYVEAILDTKPSLTSLGFHLASIFDPEDAVDLMRAAAPCLTVLDIADCKIQWDEGALAALQAVSNLQSLKLDAGRQGADCVALVAHMTELRHLVLSTQSSHISGAAWASLSCLQQLSTFHWDSAPTGPDAMQGMRAMLAAMPSIQHLHFGYPDSWIGRSAVATLLTLPSLRSLCSFSMKEAYTPASLRHLQELPHLTRLAISELSPDPACAPELARLTGLRVLELAAVSVTDHTLAVGLAGLHGLEGLTLASMQQVTGVSLPRLPQLTRLRLDTPAWDDTGMAAIAANLPALIDLQLESKAVTDLGVVALSGCRKLATVKLKTNPMLLLGLLLLLLKAGPVKADVV
ncbi:hypothetical protein WJX72_004901 [[Myrmecia] bisecta]|uniref:F-box domain-containing protein n=1 Tax=[Myrmecia] bisecta TaxID=41462 RepID=A0AAW1R6B7_9CHLO